MKKIGTAVSMRAAVAKTGIPVEAMSIANGRGCDAFKSNGTVQCDKLIAYFRANPEIIEEVESVPDIKRSKAIIADIRRKSDEIDLELKLGNLVPFDTFRKVIIRAATAARSKLMVIPDRVAQKYAMLRDASVIREDLANEI